MGTSKSVEQFSKKIIGLATATEKHANEIVAEGAKVTKATLLATAGARGVRPGGKIAGKRWSVRYDLKPGPEPTALVRFVGPFHLVESATKPHTEVPKGAAGGRRRGRGAKALRIGTDAAPRSTIPARRASTSSRPARSSPAGRRPGPWPPGSGLC